MGLTMQECRQLKAAGYSEHDIAQLAGVPTPAIVKLARFGMAPQKQIVIDVAELLKAKDAVKPEPEAVEIQPETAPTVEEPLKKEGKGK